MWSDKIHEIIFFVSLFLTLAVSVGLFVMNLYGLLTLE
jgi:hypothetical protein